MSLYPEALFELLESGKLDLKPGVTHVLVAHDPWCPKANNQPGQCICNADIRVVDPDTWAGAMNRQQRRKAARGAKKRARRGR